MGNLNQKPILYIRNQNENYFKIDNSKAKECTEPEGLADNVEIIKTLTDMKVTVNILPFLGALVMAYISYSIMQGTAQEVVYFAGVLNEIFTLVMTMMMTLGLLIMSISKAAK